MIKRYTITLEPTKRPNAPPDAQCLKRLLKALLRYYGLRCVRLGSESEETTKADAPGGSS